MSNKYYARSSKAYRFNIQNVRYLRDLVGKEKIDNFKLIRDADGTANVPGYVWIDFHHIDNLLRTMYGYGDVRWWESDNKFIVAYYQVHEPMWLVDYNKFKLALTSLLGRGPHDLVQDWEIDNDRQRLQIEAENCFEEYMQTIDPSLVSQMS